MTSTLAMFFVGRLDVTEAEGWRLEETLERLTTVALANREAWQLAPLPRIPSLLHRRPHIGCEEATMADRSGCGG